MYRQIKQQSLPNDGISRRRALILGCGAVCCTLLGCDSGGTGQTERTIELGLVDSFSIGNTELQLDNLMVHRDELGLGVMSLSCTHQGCRVSYDENKIVCPCHGAIFSKDGVVVSGPPKVNLPWFHLTLTIDRILVAHLNREVSREWRLKI